MDTIIFSEEQNRVWEALCRNMQPHIDSYCCRIYQEGFRRLAIPHDRIPSLDELNAHTTPATGWWTKRTSVRYSDAVPWYHHFARRIFLVTDFLRPWDELAFTPEPDMFHDIYGHLPYFTLPEYAELAEMFAPAFLHATAEQREHIKRLAWFSTEFGLISEEGDLKAFGAGLISSSGEMAHVMAGRTPLQAFSTANVIAHEKAIFSYNQTLFVFDSLAALKAELARYFDPILAQPLNDDGYAWQDWNLREYEDGQTDAAGAKQMAPA